LRSYNINKVFGENRNSNNVGAHKRRQQSNAKETRTECHRLSLWGRRRKNKRAGHVGSAGKGKQETETTYLRRLRAKDWKAKTGDMACNDEASLQLTSIQAHSWVVIFYVNVTKQKTERIQKKRKKRKECAIMKNI
jgi:hypothetical protein